MKKLKNLLEGLEYELYSGSIDREVTDIIYDSRKLEQDCLFMCIRGTVVDGHKFAKEADEKRASVIVAEEPVEAAYATVVLVKDTRYAMALISAAFFDHPARKLKTIAITGTKGKTTTAYMVRSILENTGHKTGLIGTIEVIMGDKVIPALNSTPESYLLHKYFHEMLEQGCEVMVMEASSQGFKMHRTAGIEFDLGIFTNLEKDHIGASEHADMEEYIACKSMLFRQCKKGIVNMDDAHLEQILAGHTCEIETFGFNEQADYRAENIKLISRGGFHGINYQLAGKASMAVEISVPGKFNVYNSLAAIAICEHFDIDTEKTKEALKNVHTKGRVEPVKVSDEFGLMIDYAHNAMALESVLKTLKEYEPGRLVCVFGCGGNRSRDRRFEMGEISGKYADFTIITSDNPRFEKPEDIIADIVTGIEKTDGSYTVIPDRKEAIRYAIKNGQKGDLILLAGKGHEDYQEICGVKYPMDERILIADILKEEGLG